MIGLDLNAAPTADDDEYSTDEDTQLTVAAPGVLGNDSDPDGESLTAELVTGPAHGTLSLAANGSFTYSPALNYNGPDSFTYRALDGHGEPSNTVTVSLTVNAVNDAPTVVVAAGGACGPGDGGTLNLTLADVDSPVGGLTLAAASSNTSLVPVSNVTFIGANGARAVTIVPVAKRSGTAVVTVTVSDGQASGTTTVTTIVGTAEDDTLTGTAGSDLIVGLNGIDSIAAGAGIDVACGGNGADDLRGGGDADSLGGGNGNDSLRGEAGDDRLTGDNGADLFSGGPGIDLATDFSAADGDTNDGSTP